MTYDKTALDRDIANFKAALDAAGKAHSEAFLPVVAPASAYWLKNEYYPSDEEFVYALADALHEEYKGIVDAGLLLQVDDAVLMHEADTMLSKGQSWEDYRRWAQLRVDALNHALRGLPEEQIRYHICFGSWHGPHAYDPPLRDSVDLVLQVRAKYYLMEQANPRHEHEWAIWEDVTLPADKVLVPGVVTHHTNVVEHPELVAQRLVRLANVVGRDRVMGGHRLRVRAGRLRAPGARGNPVGQTGLTRRGRADSVPRAMGRKGRGVIRGATAVIAIFPGDVEKSRYPRRKRNCVDIEKPLMPGSLPSR